MNNVANATKVQTACPGHACADDGNADSGAAEATAKHPNAAMGHWGIQANIGKIEIKSDEHATLGLGRIEDLAIRIASKTLGENCLCVVAGVAQ